MPDQYPDSEHRPPLRVYGWAFDDEYMLELARRRRFTFSVREYNRRYFGNVDTYNFADLTEEHLTNKGLRQSLQILAQLAVKDYIRESLHICPDIERPYAYDRKNVLVVWTNYNMPWKFRLYDTYTREGRTGKWKSKEKFLQETMNEGLPVGVERSEPLWWRSKEDPVSATGWYSLFKTIADECLAALRT